MAHSLIKMHLPGILLCLSIALISRELAQQTWLQTHAIGTLTLAILLGMLFGNTLFPRMASYSMHGVLFSKQRLLQMGIIFYGFRLTFTDIAQVGVQGAVIDFIMLSSTFTLAWFAGRKLFKLDSNTVILIGAGSAICGAAAVMATEPIVRGRAEQVSVAVSTVLLFGTLSMLLYPSLFHLNQTRHFLPDSEHAFGIYTGSTIHEVAQVVAAAKPMGDIASNTAVITKMVRVIMLAPFLILLSILVARHRPEKSVAHRAKIKLPWFALFFVAVTAINSFTVLPQKILSDIINTDTLLLATAMAALGLCTQFSAIRLAGYKPLLLGALLFLWLVLGGLFINHFAAQLMST